MCGRFKLARSKVELAKRFGVEVVETEVEWAPRYNIAPTQPVVTVRQDPREPRRELRLMRWGLIPYWTKDAAIGYKLINARSEDAAGKPAFREALRRRRCLVPADGFYEWQKTALGKQPYHFGMADGSIFAFAGLWERWKDPAGQVVESCAILTTEANALLADVHDRMPVIVGDDDYDLWLDPGLKDVEAVASILKPFDPGKMERHAVSRRVNSVVNDDPACAAAE